MSCRLKLKTAGFSIAEGVIASFLLLAAVLMSVSLFDGTLQAEVSNERRVMAAMAAESALAQIRRSADNDLANLVATYDNYTFSMPDFPGLEVVSRVEPAAIANPCTPIEENQYLSSAVFPQPEGRFLRQSAYKVQVDVSWDDRGSGSVSVCEQVVNFTPSTDFNISITRDDGSSIADTDVLSIAHRDIQSFRVQATSEGQRVSDIQYSWYVEPLVGTGSIHRVSRSGLRCQYRNGYRTFNGNLQDAPGACNLVVEATFQGVRAVDKVRIDNEA